MNVPESWLRAFCNPKLDGPKLADALTMAGLEVESYAPVGPALDNVVVAEVLSVDRHPQADKLTVCKVSLGKEQVTVVCGAPNVRAGMKADLVVFDAARVRDTAGFEKPMQYPEGIPYVAVNGKLVLDGGKRTRARPGRALLHLP